MESVNVFVFQVVFCAVGVTFLIVKKYFQSKITNLEESVDGFSQKSHSFQEQLSELDNQVVIANGKNLVLETKYGSDTRALRTENNDLNVRLEVFEEKLEDSRKVNTDYVAQVARLQTRLEEQVAATADKIEDFQQVKKQLNVDFELLANRIFEEKTERFRINSKVSLDSTLNPLREQLSDFKRKVEDVYDKDSKDRVKLGAELSQLKELNQRMTDEALNLTKALKGDNKIQGNWGEVILERVLEESGLHKGREYDTQVSLKSEGGGRRSPDVILRLPENKDIVIDSKVSLVHYENYCNNEDEAERKQALKQHIASVRGHVNGLSFKDYENLDGINSLDFVFVFIPIESAFMAAFENDQNIFREAYEKNIIVVGPTTLLATLRTVQSIWRYERQNKNAEEIARQAGAMHDKFVSFVGDLDKISEHLSRANLAHEQAMNKLTTGKGNLVSSTQRLEKLGAKVKKTVPDHLLAENESPDSNSGLVSDRKHNTVAEVEKE
ncbi:MAG: DNA recombination protein RmuC [Gammaproteobacteria bacterium]